MTASFSERGTRLPGRFAGVLEGVVANWLHTADAPRATLELAVLRGLLLGLPTAGGNERVEQEFALFLGSSSTLIRASYGRGLT